MGRADGRTGPDARQAPAGAAPARTSPPNFASNTVWTGDNLPILRGMNSACIDLIYLDPPFNSNADYSAPIGSAAAGAEFKDTWTLREVDIAWIDLIEAKHPALRRVLLAASTGSDKSYLAYMAARLIEMHRILKPTGSIYLHCDPTMSHYLKLVMDAIFGKANFRSEVIWKRTSSHNRAKRWGPVHDTILLYAGDGYTWNRVLEPLDEEYVRKSYRHADERGRYSADNLTGPGLRDGDTGQPWRDIDPGNTKRHWELPPDRALPDWFMFPKGYAEMPARGRLDILDAQGLIYWPAKGGMPRFKRYLTEDSGAPINDVVTDISPLGAQARERTGYPTQKPLALLERIIAASSNPGDMVLDPFCGCATTCVAADRLGREWAGIDLSRLAVELVNRRIAEDRSATKEKSVIGGNLWGGALQRDAPPQRTDIGKIPRYNSPENRKYLYGEQGGHCAGCREHFQPRHLEVDHIIAQAQNGGDHIENLQLLCGACNKVKGNRGMEYLKARLEIG